jgi:hypothetical protein
VQEQEPVQVRTIAQTTGLGAKLDLFIGVDTQIGQYELRPVLMQVAEKHQPQAIAQVHHGKAVQRVGQVGAPLGKTARFAELRRQARQPVGFVALGLVDPGLERRQDFALLQQRKQRLERQRASCVEPTQLQQRPSRGVGATDLLVIEFARPEMHALAHHHAHQQRLGGLRQAVKLLNEMLFVRIEQIGIALPQPMQDLTEVMQVIERIFEGIGHGAH